MLKEKVLTLSKQEWENFEKELAHPKPANKALKELINVEGFDASSTYKGIKTFNCANEMINTFVGFYTLDTFSINKRDV